MEQRAKLILVITILFELIAAPTTAQQISIANDPSCWTPDNEIGVCVPIVNCDRITWLLTSSTDPTSPFVVDYVRRSHCSTVGTTYYGCCARHNLKRTSAIVPQRPPTVAPPPPRLPPPAQFPQPGRGVLAHSTAHQLLSTDNIANEIDNEYLELTAGRSHVPPTGRTQPTSNHNHNHYDHNRNHHLHPNHNHGASQWTAPVGERILDSMPCGPVAGDRIANGESVRLSEFPWMALLEYATGTESEARSRFLCGGSLITDRYVLTAAHCVVGRHELRSVRLGEHDLNATIDCGDGPRGHRGPARRNCAPPAEDVGVERIIPHPEYREGSLSHDIALLRLNRTVRFQKHIKPICLPRTEGLPDRAIVSGWGITEHGFASDVLLKAEIPIRRIGYCQSIFRHSMSLETSTCICAGGELGKSTCRGDSGSPLIAAVDSGWPHVRYYQFGIVSAGSPSCDSSRNYPGIFTKIAPYMPWIIGNLAN